MDADDRNDILWVKDREADEAYRAGKAQYEREIGGSVQATAEALTRHAAMYSIDRAERAEAKLARIRELLAEYRDDPVAYGQQVARRVLEIMDGDANADDS